MKPLLFQTTDWEGLEVDQKPGESGMARYKIMEFENFRVRLVEYSKNYRADHWCSTGHIVYCLEGEMRCELSDNTAFVLKKGMSYVVSDDASEHRSSSEHGAKIMIIDGDFLKTARQPDLNPWRM